MPEVLREKRCSLKFRKIHRKHLCQRKHCELCKIFKNPFFTEQLHTTASEIWILQKRSERNRFPLLQRGGMLIATARP